MKVLHLIAVRRYFKLFFAFSVFVNTLNLSYLGVTLNPLFYLVILWGGYILLHDLCTKELFYRGNHILPLVGYLICIGIATLLNPYHQESSYILWYLQGLLFLLVFTQARSTSLMMIKQEMKQMGILVCSLTFVAAVISLCMFFFHVTLTRNGVSIGMVDGRLFGIYFNSNPAAFLSCMSIVFAMLALRNHYRFPYAYMVHIVVQLLYIILTGCRSAILILAMLVVILLYYTLFKRKAYTILQEVLIAMLAICIVVVGAYVLKQALYLIPRLQGFVLEHSGRFHLEEIIDTALMIKQDPWQHRQEIISTLDSISSSRIELWYNSFRMWKETPFFGIGVDTFHTMGSTMFPSSIVMAQPQVVHTHNFILETLVVGGVVGFLCFFLFTFQAFTKLLEVMRRYTHTPSYYILLLLTMIVWIEVMGGLLDYGIFYVYSLSSFLFWLVLGYLYYFHERAVDYLVVNHEAYEFVSYRLEEVRYHREKGVELASANLHIAKEELFDFRYHQRLQVLLFFTDATNATFLYEGIFQMRRAYANGAGIEAYQREMALELYDIIKQDIINLASDEEWKLQLPAGMQDLI